ncbi:MAG: hypothetical protein OZ948_03670 [Deltaproteobacteria bacterium]|nr:hypothetical protein [Deltaproteobacteria bacterium]
MRARGTFAPFVDRAGSRAGRRIRTAARAPAAALLLAWLVAAAPAARADEHDPERAAHPVRIAAYVLHPIGVVLDYLIVRPAHWVVEREPFRTLFGHED